MAKLIYSHGEQLVCGYGGVNHFGEIADSGS